MEEILIDTGRVTPGPGSAAAMLEADLEGISFESVVAAIEQARPGFNDQAEIRLYQKWIAANDGVGPHLFVAWFNLGVALARAGESRRAAVAYSHVRKLKPEFYPGAVNLGLALEAMGESEAALQAWDGAIQNAEARTTLLNHRGRLMEKLGRLDEAEATFRISLLTHPAQPNVVQHWVHVRQKMCLWPALGTDIPARSPQELLLDTGPLSVLALTDSVTLQRQVASSWVARKMPAATARLAPPDGYRHERIRLGYLSSDFCRHAMSYLIAELFERHDRARFEVFGYCASRDDGSEIRRRVLAAFDHHRDIRSLTDEQAAAQIRADEIDILIDLNGLTEGTRLGALRWKPAPVQATYLGYVGPVPLPELDYLLCDDVVIPPAMAGQYSPTPLPIPNFYQANDSKRGVGRKLSRAEVGLPADRFVFCSFSRHYKITEEIAAAWIEILRATGDSVLWLARDNVWSETNLRKAFSRAGIAHERLVFADRIDPDLYMSRLALADLYLDTFPYNAGTVASDALRMGLPLLTRSGDAFASRMAASLLTILGQPDGIPTNAADYVAKAIELATDAAAYRRFRAPFTPAAWARSVGDCERFTDDLEATLAGLSARPQAVPPAPAIRRRIPTAAPAPRLPHQTPPVPLNGARDFTVWPPFDAGRWLDMNPTFVRHREAAWAVFTRYAAPPVPGTGSIWAVRVDADMRPIGAPVPVIGQGMDPRAIVVGSRVLIFYALIERNGDGAIDGSCVALAEFDVTDDHWTFLEGSRLPKHPVDRRLPTHAQTNWEKNWVPFAIDNATVALIYAHDPWDVITLNVAPGTPRRLVDLHCGAAIQWDYGPIRGGTPPVRYDDTHLVTFFHSSQTIGSRNVYSVGACVFLARAPYSPISITGDPLLIAPYCSGAERFGWGFAGSVVFPLGAARTDSGWRLLCGRDDGEIASFDVSAEEIAARLVSPSRGPTGTVHDYRGGSGARLPLKSLLYVPDPIPGIPELPMINFVRTIAGRGRTFLDIGSHIGFYTMGLAPGFERVVAFEPSRFQYGWLRRNAALNAYDHVRCEHVALGDTAGATTLNVLSYEGGLNTLSPEVASERRILDQYTVPVEVLDDRGLTDVDLLKIDVEGFELHVLRGAAKTIAASRPAILIEVWTDTARRQDVRNIMSEMDYTLEFIFPRSPELAVCLPRERRREYVWFIGPERG